MAFFYINNGTITSLLVSKIKESKVLTKNLIEIIIYICMGLFCIWQAGWNRGQQKMNSCFIKWMQLQQNFNKKCKQKR